MNRDDRRRLVEPYPADGTDVSSRLARRLGVYVGEAIELEREILADLDEKKFGVGWWAPHPGTSRRILISDYLWQCCHSVQNNLTEAALHLIEARGAWEDAATQLERGLRVGRDGKASFAPADIAAPIDELPQELHWLHVAGLMRAVGSTLDCIGGAAVGVAGLKRSILTADLDRVFQLGDKLVGADPGTAFQRRVITGLRTALDQAGPPGWWRWTGDYRNMLVHRGRRTRKGGGYIQDSPILGADAQPVARLLSFPMLPRDPSRSDVEVMRHPRHPDHLTEDGHTTLEGVVRSTVTAVTLCATELRAAWQERRKDPDLVLQPREQWKDVKTSEAPFAGYAPGSLTSNFGQVYESEVAMRRLNAAAATADLSKKWETFD